MPSHQFKSRLQRLIALWVLRAFSPSLSRSKLLNGLTYSDQEIAKFLGLPLELDLETVLGIPKLLDELQSKLEQSKTASFQARAQSNFDQFGRSLKLNSIEQRVLEYYACVTIASVLIDTFRVTGISAKDAPRYLSKVLDLPYSSVVKVLSCRGRLFICGLLRENHSPHRGRTIDFHSPSLAENLLYKPYDARDILRLFGVVTPSSPELCLADYPYIHDCVDILLPYLKMVKEKVKEGSQYIGAWITRYR